jgi:hypothetical protein
MARICWGESARLAGIFFLCKCGGLWYNTVNMEAEVEKALMKKRWKRLGIGIAASAAAAGIALTVYAGDDYRAGEEALAALVSDETVEVELLSDGFVFAASEAKAGLIFYPGGKVEYRAYLPLCHKIAAGGIDCFLLEMPCNLAVLDINKADSIFENYTYPEWIIGGHSLGGAAAAIYAADHKEQVQGLLLLGAYPTKQLGADLYVLELYGSEDRVLNRDRLLKGNDFLPVHTVREEIPGGNHAGFGSYGPQKGDGPAGISGEEQQEITAQRTADMFPEDG